MTRLFTEISSFFIMSPYSLQIRFLMIALTRRHQRRNLPKHLRSERQIPELQRLCISCYENSSLPIQSVPQ